MDRQDRRFISLQTKFITLILCGILFSAFVIGLVGITTSTEVIDSDSNKLMNLSCENEANLLNATFQTMVQSMDECTHTAQSGLTAPARLKDDPLYVLTYLYNIELSFNRQASNDDRIISYYYHLNPELAPGDAGFHYIRHRKTGNYQPVDSPDLSDYSRTDTKVSWYYTAAESGIAQWVKPHFDSDYGVNVISYLQPVYKNHRLIGVIGMDLDFSSITQSLDSVKPYTSSIALLLDHKGHIVYHPDIDFGTNSASLSNEIRKLTQRIRISPGEDQLLSYTYKGVQKKLTWRGLDNRMRLVLCAPASEIDAKKNQLINRIISAAILISGLFALITFSFVDHIIRPLRRLTQAASRIADGDLEIDLIPESNDEVGALTVSFTRTASALKQYIADVRTLAYRDPLTGVFSKTAYTEDMISLNAEIKNRTAPMAVILFDVNHLKRMNDTHGHAAGDLYISNCCYFLCAVFLHSPVYRVGGDEFVTILKGNEFQNREALLTEFSSRMEEISHAALTPVEQISIAYGMAAFDPDSSPEGTDYQSLFREADDHMYHQKLIMKGQRTD